MAFLKVSSPHAHRRGTAGDVMKLVILATIPGLISLSYFFGPGTLMNVVMMVAACVGFEAAVLKLRKRPIGFYLNDYSAVVTGVLLGIAIPPLAPWWLIAVGAFVAIVIAKQLYGGMGYNPFNPAMVGYVVLLISFPVQMSHWAPPRGLGDVPGLVETWQHLFAPSGIDAVTAATPLDLLRQNTGLLFDDLLTERAELSGWAGVGWFEVNLAFLAGGAWLLHRRIFTWHAPIAMLVALSLSALMGYDGGSSESGGSALFHLFSGATMFAAFFIITDPVSSAVSNRGRLIFGALIGLLIYLIRVLGNYPDAVAFAVLILNFCAPFIDHYTQPTVYGTRSRDP